ncbi:Ribokinase-like protein [Terfezia boudieri ATCC MYA-4762]|uniref:ATP-dependent (S)-NAD(P)H-hydrate dehydratase n=1 Tax=Terfezia boudieri ATCC MYA-4762 TaxID=1051890 RepID=A0A3N4LPD2_9PEZI|nr:Ribokinase-like protein [Terfezia boudieri ATCC MYA-4762]
MALTQSDLLLKVRQFIPPLLEAFHKGQQGRVAVVGGCEDYTGAPYFSAHASALLGCDMSHVICDPHASLVIKSYSPNLMVHPYMRSTSASSPSSSTSASLSDSEKGKEVDLALHRIMPLLPRLHVLVVGPGLGRDPIMKATVARLIFAARNSGLAIVVDADALLVVQEDPELVKGYSAVVLTPNHAEFARLCKSLGISMEEEENEGKGKGELCEKVARTLGGVTVLRKGREDWISNGLATVQCSVRGGRKRSGGQGDTLTGCVGTLLAWRRAYLEGLWEHDKMLNPEELTLLSAFGASAITRLCSRRAFEKKGRSMQASDLSEEMNGAFGDLFEGEAGAVEAKL